VRAGAEAAGTVLVACGLCLWLAHVEGERRYFHAFCYPSWWMGGGAERAGVRGCGMMAAWVGSLAYFGGSVYASRLLWHGVAGGSWSETTCAALWVVHASLVAISVGDRGAEDFWPAA
jgi:hypothetical protein